LEYDLISGISFAMSPSPKSDILHVLVTFPRILARLYGYQSNSVYRVIITQSRIRIRTPPLHTPFSCLKRHRRFRHGQLLGLQLGSGLGLGLCHHKLLGLCDTGRGTPRRAGPHAFSRVSFKVCPWYNRCDGVGSRRRSITVASAFEASLGLVVDV